MNNKCIVTGGAGFIGSHLVDILLGLRLEVIIIDDFSSGKEENIQQHATNKRLTVLHKSICDPDLGCLIDMIAEDVICVFHLAAIPRVQYSIKYPDLAHEANIQGTFNLLEACRQSGISRFIYAASSSAYGNQTTMPLVETMIPNPLSPYALQKLVGEQYCSLYHDLYGIKTISLRFFNVFGPRQSPKGDYACLIPKSINKVLLYQRPEIYGDGLQSRDFTYIKDVVSAIMKASRVDNEKAFGQVFNIGAGNNYSVNDVVKIIIDGRDINPIRLPPVAEPRHTLADISKAREMLGWEPSFFFHQGIETTVKWMANKAHF